MSKEQRTELKQLVEDRVKCELAAADAVRALARAQGNLEAFIHSVQRSDLR